nr:polyphosphate kinase 1 [Lachnospiraceae bacterium]
QVPSVLSRVIEIPSAKNVEGRSFIFLEEVIARNMEALFLNYEIVAVCPFRIMRNADLSIEEEEAEDLLAEIEKQLKKRQWGEAIRLELPTGVSKELLKIVRKELDISQEEIYTVSGPLDLTVLMQLYGIDGFEHLKDKKYKPQPVVLLPEGCNIFDEIKKQDILLHHPYETFQPVVDFVKSAAKDPGVLAIKQTLYRVSGNSPIIAALAQAAENGKQVSVLVELKARFDEENNIVWAKKLEQAGCHVIYGLVGLKTHSKITLIVRKEDDGIRRYVHLGTGNYNDSTAKLYTDLGLLTCREDIGEDATAVFNMLSGYSEPKGWNKLSVAPLWLKDRFLYLIKREQRFAESGEEAHITAKMNSLCDPDIIAALYEASTAGVTIDLIVRGICCLRTGVKGVSENIRVRSVVGTFLEHSRIFCFENGGSKEYYLASADWMPRNLNKRVEIMFPIEQEDLKERVAHVLDCLLRDTKKAQLLHDDGTYERVDKRGKELFGAQENFCKEAVARSKVLKKDPIADRVFQPEKSKGTDE